MNVAYYFLIILFCSIWIFFSIAQGASEDESLVDEELCHPRDGLAGEPGHREDAQQVEEGNQHERSGSMVSTVDSW